MRVDIVEEQAAFYTSVLKSICSKHRSISRRSLKMTKTKRSRSQKEITHDEIQALLTKLKEIVPNMPRNRKLSKLEIIQYVIDYIVDLQIALESHPISHRGVNARSGSPSTRQPLGVISSPSNSAANTCVASEPNHVEKLPSQRPDAVFRSVSC
ncbi:hypothetical protein NPIL_571391 [Nephila pilipes]|uniref:BHLH domain-containing protein n=1 Tax=Nephila pilipes TaxID=299642 RepID=A0A8X6UL71_NEPPI|nr:hypothetical protein NPIL_571391 [Nephila pilipes]